MPWVSYERAVLSRNDEKCYGCDLQCFITIINTGLNDVKCSKASNTLCIIHDPCVVILLLLFQSTFPPVIMFPVLGKLLLPQRWSRKTFFFASSRETDECWGLSTRPRRLHLPAFPYISHPPFFFFIQNENCSSGAIIDAAFLEFGVFSTLSSRHKQQHVLEGINTQTDVELVKILSKWPANSQA